MNVNPAGEDWRLLKAKLGELIADNHGLMEQGLSVEEYNAARGRVAMARELIEWVEPTTPPLTVEDDYGISNPDGQE